MSKGSMGDATILAQEEIFSLDLDEELAGKEYISDFDDIKLLSEGIKNRALKLGFNGQINNVNEISAFVYKLCLNSGIDISIQTLKNWLISGVASGNEIGRRNIYKLCFALGFNAEQTSDFFLKCYLERPFNYRNIEESIYFFCMKNGKTFKDAERISSIALDIKVEHDEHCEENTVSIRNSINKIKTEEKLLEYISKNINAFSSRNKTAIKKIEKLINECISVGQKYSEQFLKHEELGKINSIDDVFRIFYGFAGREKHKGSVTFKKGISSSRFPEYIKRNFPQRQQIENILKGKATYDVIRKALIILQFGLFFMKAKLADMGNDYFDEFTDEMDTILDECGYIGLYLRNPFDWMISYCAFRDDPLEELRLLIDEFYLSNEDIY